MIKPFFLALQFMSRLPTPQYAAISAKEMGQAVSFFPVVGAVIGLILMLSGWGLSQLPLPTEITAALVLAIWAWVTGGLHLDGLADTADGWLGGVGDHQRALTIMKDSRIGTGGGVALVIFLLLKWLAIKALLLHQAWLWLLFAPIIGRIAAIALMPTTRYVSQAGLAEEMSQHLNRWHIALWTLLALSFLLYLDWKLAAGLGILWIWGRWLMIRITGGMTGDTAGMMTELMELGFMLGLICFIIS